MVFSSLVFLSVFLPTVLLCYWLLPSIAGKNILLLAASLFFYAYGEPVYVFLMLASSLFHYLCALWICADSKRNKMILAAVIAVNLGLLCVFKYAAFLTDLFNRMTGLGLPVPQVALPAGISFFTFQAMSYVIDVYRSQVRPQRNFAYVLLYICLFPQLIAGPIVKYHDVEQELFSRRFDAEETARGIRRFIAGLGKKVLIANYMGEIADTLFAAPMEQVNMAGAWLGAASYMLQIYFDFSGYSDMAIGMGHMFGFHFRENFRYPYGASSIREFWRRWHISLSGWFREYLYIPLGGSRKGRARTCLNKFFVFACTGIWHGANVTFLFWGLFHGCLLMLEEYLPFFQQEKKGWKKAAGHLYVIVAVMTGFVFFRADHLGQGAHWILKMCTGLQYNPAAARLTASLLTPVHLAAFAAGILASVPAVRSIGQAEKLQKLLWPSSLALLLICMLNLAGGTYNPFIYFRF
ncbi:MAG: MBOAT family protein [Eubacterium sp.]|nr:MBOAT family protein [Eubacterium sp.]